MDSVEALLPLHLPLRRSWSLEKILALREGAGSGTAESRKKLIFVDRAICNVRFWAYLEMIHLCGSAIKHVTAWSEGCRCHTTHHFRPNMGGIQVQQGFRRPAVHKARCPMASRRAPEAAVGELHRCMHDCLHMVNSTLLLSSTYQACDEPSRLIIISDLGAARRHITMQFQLKLGHWAECPWRFCGLAHPDKEQQVETARLCLQQYEHSGDVADHHWLTHILCDPQNIPGQQMRLLASRQARRSQECNLTLVAADSCFRTGIQVQILELSLFFYSTFVWVVGPNISSSECDLKSSSWPRLACFPSSELLLLNKHCPCSPRLLDSIERYLHSSMYWSVGKLR